MQQDKQLDNQLDNQPDKNDQYTSQYTNQYHQQIIDSEDQERQDFYNAVDTWYRSQQNQYQPKHQQYQPSMLYRIAYGLGSFLSSSLFIIYLAPLLLVYIITHNSLFNTTPESFNILAHAPFAIFMLFMLIKTTVYYLANQEDYKVYYAFILLIIALAYPYKYVLNVLELMKNTLY